MCLCFFFHFFFFFFFNDTATTEIYTLSLHDALPIPWAPTPPTRPGPCMSCGRRSEEHTSELQSRPHLVCRLLLEKKKKNNILLQKENEDKRKPDDKEKTKE